MKKYIKFNADWQIKADTGLLDMSSFRVLKHLKALVRGGGSSTENIVIDFVKNTTENLVEYRCFRDAWDKLDFDQKDMVVGFRAFISKTYISATSGDFVSEFYCNLVRDRYHELEEIKSEHSPSLLVNDELPIDIKHELAKQADREIRSKVGDINAVPAFSVEECQDDL